MSTSTPDEATTAIASAAGDLERPAAVVFDSDGVLLDSEPSWKAARSELFERYGRTFGETEERESVGTGVAGTGRLLSRLLDRPDCADELADEFAVLLAAEISEGVRPLPGAIALVDELRGSVPIAVASNSPREILLEALEAGGLDEAFDVVVGADEVSEGKPAPDLYLAASERLGVSPGESVAVEDSPSGVAAARAAGLYVIGIPSLADMRLEADMTADSLDDTAVREKLGVADPTLRQRRPWPGQHRP